MAGLPDRLVQFYCASTSTSAAGTFQVRRGAGIPARLVSFLFRLPPSGDNVPVRLSIRRASEAEIWKRTFGERRVISRQRACGERLLCERFGPVEFRFRLIAERQAIRFSQTGVTLWTVRLPHVLAPQVEAITWCEPGEQGLRVQVRVTAPVFGLLLRYEGLLNEDGVMASGAAGRDRSV